MIPLCVNNYAIKFSQGCLSTYTTCISSAKWFYRASLNTRICRALCANSIYVCFHSMLYSLFTVLLREKSTKYVKEIIMREKFLDILILTLVLRYLRKVLWFFVKFILYKVFQLLSIIYKFSDGFKKIAAVDRSVLSYSDNLTDHMQFYHPLFRQGQSIVLNFCFKHTKFIL